MNKQIAVLSILMVAAYAVSYLKGSSHATFAVVARQELTDVRNGTKTKWKDVFFPNKIFRGGGPGEAPFL